MTKLPTVTRLSLDRTNQTSARQAQRVHNFIARALKIIADGDNKARVASHQCSYCYYLDRPIVGHAFTQWACGHCDHVDVHPNTGVPRVCRACSVELGLCVTCGGDMRMERRSTIKRNRKLRTKAVAP